MAEYVNIREPMITADKVLERWPGMLDGEMAAMIDADPFEDVPAAYRVGKVLSDGNGNVIAKCVRCESSGNYYVHCQGNDRFYDFTEIAFKLSEIIRHEQRNPELLYQLTHPDEAWSICASGVHEKKTHAGMATLSSDDVINRLKITPIELVDILNGVCICDDYNNYVDTKRLVTTDEEGFRAHSYSEPYFTVVALKRVTIYQLDFDRYCETWGTQKQAKPESADTAEIDSQLAEVKSQLVEKDTRIAALESDLAAARQQIAELTASAAPACDGKGLPVVVCRMRREGKSEAEIAAHLSDNGDWCSAAQIGALLHPDEKSKIASESMRQAANRLLGKA